MALDLRMVSHDPMMGAAVTLATTMGSSRDRASGGIIFRMSGKDSDAVGDAAEVYVGAEEVVALYLARCRASADVRRSIAGPTKYPRIMHVAVRGLCPEASKRSQRWVTNSK